jgi:hypothetical protein
LNITLFSRGDGLGHFWSWVYFHGDMEDYVAAYRGVRGAEWEAPDLVSGLTRLDAVPDGVHRVTVYGLPGLAFLWTEPQTSVGWTFHGDGRVTTWNKRVRRGLVVRDGDEPARRWAARGMVERLDH